MPKDDKCIIFTQNNDTLRRITDYLDLENDIKFSEFHTKIVSFDLIGCVGYRTSVKMSFLI